MTCDPEAPAPPLRALALSAVLALALLLRWTTLAQVEDLRPWPDALEYEEAAHSLHEGRGYLLWIADRAYPPRYPPGLSALIAATPPVVGTALGSGIWVVLASALAAVAGAWVLGRTVAGFACGLVAAVLVATSPLHVQWSRAVMSDVPASAAVVWLAVGVVVVVRRRAGATALLALGAAAGLAASIRYAVLAVVPAGAFVVACFARGGSVARARRVLALLLGVLLGVLPLLWSNAVLFGSAFRDGYAYWVSGDLVSASYVLEPRASGAPSNAWFYGTLLLGGGALYPLPGALLLALGSLRAARRAGDERVLGVLAWLVLALVLALHGAFFWQWDRFLLPAFPLLAVLMALPCAPGWDPRLRAAAGLLVAAALLMVALHPERYAPPDPPAYDVATLRRIAAIAEPNAAVLARSNPFFIARLLRAGSDRVWVPLATDPHTGAIERERLAPVRRDAGGHDWIRPALRLPFRAERAIAAVEVLCREGRPVYLSMQLDLFAAFLPRLRDALAGHFGLTEVIPPEPYAIYRVDCTGGLRGRAVPDG